MKYKLEDLKPGMIVKEKELSNIYNTYIVLDNAKTVFIPPCHFDNEGTIVFISKELSDETDRKLKASNGALCCIYNTYDEELGEIIDEY